jgi:hypothetical protein
MRLLSSVCEQVVHQDNRCTAIPIFVVQQLVYDYGYDADYRPDHWAWSHVSGDLVIREDTDPVEWNRLNALDNGEAPAAPEPEDDDEDDEVPPSLDKFRKVYYVERWEFVTACFTEQGCKDYLRLNAHNLHKPRIYVEGGYRNEEWELIRKLLTILSKNPDGLTGQLQVLLSSTP